MELVLTSKGSPSGPQSGLQEAWDLSTEAYLLLHSDGGIVFGNDKSRSLFAGCVSQRDVFQRFVGVKDLRNGGLLAAKDRAARTHCNFVSSSGEVSTVEVEQIPVNNGTWLVLRSVDTPDRENGIAGFASALLDSSEALILVTDGQGKLVRFNRQAEKLSGYSEQEVVGERFLDLFLAPEDLPRAEAEFARILSGQFPSQMEVRCVMRDGSPRTISWSSTGLLDAAGKVECVVSTGIDFTAFRRVEGALASLSEQALNQIQGERRKLSRFLHDTVSQDLVALSFSISRLQQDQSTPASLSVLDRSLQLVDRCCRDIRLISYILAPPLFEEMGFVPALKWYGGQLQREAGMEVDLDFDDLPELALSSGEQSILFATLQSCVARSVRHPDKSRKRVALQVQDNLVTLRYESFFSSDGASDTKPEELLQEFAVIGERLRQFRGRLEVEEGPESISVVASVPLQVIGV